MDWLGLNKGALDGRTVVSWVIAAAAAASGAASGTVSATQIFADSAYGAAGASAIAVDAAVVRYDTDSAAIGTCTASAVGTLVLNGHANGSPTASGLAAVKRTVYAIVNAHAGATGYAIPASQLGAVTGTPTSRIVQAVAHLVRPGAASHTCGANGTVAGTRNVKPTVLASCGVAHAWADWRYKANGQSHWVFDGKINAWQATATSSLTNVQGETAVFPGRLGAIGTAGATQVACTAHIVFWAISFTNTGASCVQAAPTRSHPVTASASASCTSTVHATRTTFCALSMAAASSGPIVRPTVHYAGHVSSAASASNVQAKPKMRYAGAAFAAASASDNNPTTSNFYSITAQGAAGASSVSAYAGVIYGGVIFAQAGASAAVYASAKHGDSAAASASASGSAFGTIIAPQRSTVLAATSTSGIASASIKYRASASASTHTTGSAEGLTNPFVSAPDDRTMYVDADDRTFFIDFEDRVLYVS